IADIVWSVTEAIFLIESMSPTYYKLKCQSDVRTHQPVIVDLSSECAKLNQILDQFRTGADTPTEVPPSEYQYWSAWDFELGIESASWGEPIPEHYDANRTHRSSERHILVPVQEERTRWWIRVRPYHHPLCTYFGYFTVGQTPSDRPILVELQAEFKDPTLVTLFREAPQEDTAIDNLLLRHFCVDTDTRNSFHPLRENNDHHDEEERRIGNYVEVKWESELQLLLPKFKRSQVSHDWREQSLELRVSVEQPSPRRGAKSFPVKDIGGTRIDLDALLGSLRCSFFAHAPHWNTLKATFGCQLLLRVEHPSTGRVLEFSEFGLSANNSVECSTELSDVGRYNVFLEPDREVGLGGPHFGSFSFSTYDFAENSGMRVEIPIGRFMNGLAAPTAPFTNLSYSLYWRCGTAIESAYFHMGGREGFGVSKRSKRVGAAFTRVDDSDTLVARVDERLHWIILGSEIFVPKWSFEYNQEQEEMRGIAWVDIPFRITLSAATPALGPDGSELAIGSWSVSIMCASNRVIQNRLDERAFKTGFITGASDWAHVSLHFKDSSPLEEFELRLPVRPHVVSLEYHERDGERWWRSTLDGQDLTKRKVVVVVEEQDDG
ncbi:MAG: hypothetical protein KDB07_02580, partial [Planctomycetes bacterium]|nr:hypothetical protein [Planctomycetota bacterium]